MSSETPEKIEGITLVPTTAEEQLNRLQKENYRGLREKQLNWFLNVGKKPAEKVGYSPETMGPSFSRMNGFYIWLWENHGYTTTVSHHDADAYMEYIADQDHSNHHKKCVVKSLKRLFKWKAHVRGGEEWNTDKSFSTERLANPKDIVTLDEREAIRNASLKYHCTPERSSLSDEEEDEWLQKLAQRLETPKDEITDTKWEEATSWKIPSLIMTALDAGLRPKEVGRLEVSWIDLENELLRIPREQATKSESYWRPVLKDQTVNALRPWLHERSQIEKYDESEKVWLTREGNPYDSAPLKDILLRLYSLAGVDTSDRDLTWYSIRHSTGTYMTMKKDRETAASQLRHKCPDTTSRYIHPPPEYKKDAVEMI